MGIPRFSIRFLAFVVTVIAADCALLRSAPIRDEPEGIAFGLLASLAMANLLALGLYDLTRRGRHRAFLIGFESSGLLALALFLMACRATSHIRYMQLYQVLRRIELSITDSLRLEPYHGSFVFNWSFSALYLGIFNALFSIPLLVTAVACGLLARHLSAKRAAGTVGPADSHLSLT